jgi:hypothetical protein
VTLFEVLFLTLMLFIYFALILIAFKIDRLKK